MPTLKSVASDSKPKASAGALWQHSTTEKPMLHSKKLTYAIRSIILRAATT